MSGEHDNSKDIGESSRIRTTSECSIASDDGLASAFTGKRLKTIHGLNSYWQRTASQTFMVASGGLTAASPPKFVSLEEIMQAANGMRDMNLVHQIVVDENFRLEKAEPEPNTIHKVVKDAMHKAFWDVLRSELAEDPPNYKQAFVLLEEVKQGLLDLLLPQHTKIKQQICEVLDTDLIKQQAEQGILDFKYYAQYIISIMAKMCAPVRDDTIKQLTETTDTDVVDTFKAILEMIELMHIDMANFTLTMIRPDIINHSVELEREKFANFLAVQSDGLDNTKKWLLQHVTKDVPVPKDVEYEKFLTKCSKKAFCVACIDLLDWDRTKSYPETFVLDEERLYDLQIQTFQLVTCATILLVTLNNIGADLQSIGAFKQSLKEHITILMQAIKDNKTLEEALPNIAEQVLSDVKAAQNKYKLSELGQDNEGSLKNLILGIGKEEHKVRTLVKQRVDDFFLDIIESATAAPQKVPSGLTAFQQELTAIAGQFLRIVSHNSTVFCIYYYDIVAEALPKPA